MTKTAKPVNRIAAKLRIVRLRRRMTQGELAEATGLKPAAICHFERGARQPNLRNLVRLADALAVSTDELLCR